ncbi:CBS domain-containing protein [Bacillus sp. DNRA2]|uniref:CBS domain-containing protein n=1 Tax=Bacillus sp. DNRA2 TaxID=2723053 RepID=UPI00145E3C23|nr:CBS domain-containing protein [Bacillus sp. DNRA2]NMD70290.1 CBS domain-containing protein [Bacillus sp. DNRA2]
MFVKSIMIPKHHCITVNGDDPLQLVLEKMEAHQIDGIPVLNGEEYIGVVTRFNIYRGFFESELQKVDYLQQTKANGRVSFQDKYLTGNELFEATLLDLKDFPLIAVLDNKKHFKGIVTRADVLEQFQSAFGNKRPGVRIAFTSAESEGRIARLAEIAQSYHERIISFVTFDETDQLVRRIVMKIEKNANIEKFIKKLEDSGFRVLSIHED